MHGSKGGGWIVTWRCGMVEEGGKMGGNVVARRRWHTGIGVEED